MTYRADLLALTPDDLMVLSNRGLVKRAQRELAAGQLTYEVSETQDKGLQFTWSDEVVCELPVADVLCDRHCSCTATTLCRHLIRSVLAYQASAETSSPPSTSHQPEKKKNTGQLSNTQSPAASSTVSIPKGQTPDANAPWNPGNISDEALRDHFRPAQLKKLKRDFEAGQIIEVTCSRKPTAQLHNFPHNLRFLVPHDLRYTYCDCSNPSPCPHVPLAIWAFRRLKDNQQSGIISTETEAVTIPTDLLDDIEKTLADLVMTGLQGLSPGFMANLAQLEERCDHAALIWPANILTDLITTFNFYRRQDARFSPEHVTQLVAELCIRCDAIRAHTGAIPQLFIRGPHSKRLTELGSTRLIGLGCSVRIQHNNFSLEAYFQDTDSGKVLVKASELKPLPSAKTASQSGSLFADIAQTQALKQVTWTALGAGQLLIKRGACSPNYQFHLKRNQPAIVNPQRFEWEKLRSPILVDDFMELQQRLQSLPPQALRPRRLTERFYVFSLSRIGDVTFSSTEQAITATLYDQYHNLAYLYFPYTNHAHEGTEAFINLLMQHPIDFISGQVSIRSSQLIIQPTSAVFEGKNGRELIQPWLYNPTMLKQRATTPSQHQKALTHIVPTEIREKTSLETYLLHLAQRLSTQFINGLSADTSGNIKDLEKLLTQGQELGFTRLSRHLAVIKDQLSKKAVQHDVLAKAYLNSLVFLEILQ